MDLTEENRSPVAEGDMEKTKRGKREKASLALRGYRHLEEKLPGGVYGEGKKGPEKKKPCPPI